MTLIFVLRFQYMKFWTKSLYMVEKFLLVKKKNVTKIFGKKPTFFKIVTEEERWRNFLFTFSEPPKKLVVIIHRS